MTERKNDWATPPEQGQEDNSSPEPKARVTRAEDLGPTGEAPKPAEGEPEFAPYEARKGWVEDRDGRHHEVDDRQRFLEAYPGSKLIKSGDKSKVGYAEPKAQA